MIIPRTESMAMGLRLGILALTVFFCTAALVLHAGALANPLLIQDDFQILEHSYTWQAAWQNLGRSHNEHVMPLGRLSTWLLVQAAGRPSALPGMAALQGPIAVVIG